MPISTGSHRCLKNGLHSSDFDTHVGTHPHVEVDVGGVHHGGDGVDHVEPHLDRVPRVVSASFWQARDAVVAVAKDLDSQAAVVLQ